MRATTVTAVLVFLLGATGQAVDLQILVPLYSYPAWYNPAAYLWDDVAAAAHDVPVTVIINPNNGPNGGPPNSDYVVGLNDLRAGGVTILGYVYTSYGSRPLTNVQADVDLYAQYYNIHGIFFDEVASATNQLEYYRQLFDYVKAKTNLHIVVTNPGTHFDERYLTRPATDTAVIFENGSGWSAYAPDAYVSNYPAARFAALVYNTPDEATMRSNVDFAVHRNIGYVYVTDDSGANPWDTLPTYWTAEVAYVKALRALRITNLTLDGAAARLTFTTVSNKLFAVETGTNLAARDWTALTSNITGTGGTLEIGDPAAGLAPSRFYRVRLLP